jgi:hypothetical protein
MRTHLAVAVLLSSLIGAGGARAVGNDRAVRPAGAPRVAAAPISRDSAAPSLRAARLTRAADPAAPRLYALGSADSQTLRTTLYGLELVAADRGSGVAWVQATTSLAHPGQWTPYRATLAIESVTHRLWVRVRDRAGNVSSWQLARL